MTPHGFSHLYELFATFTLAYIIIDELTENPFVSLISEKILKKYSTIHKIHSEVKSKIQGYKISIKSIKQLNLTEEIVTKDLPRQELNLESIETRAGAFFDKVYKRIRRNYTTKIFVFLNCYLLLYCMSMLFFGGLYDETSDFQPTKKTYNLNLDNSLLVFFICSLVFLIAGWIKDKQQVKLSNKANSGNLIEEDNNSHEKIDNSYIVENGYYISGLFFIGVIIFSVLTYIFSWRFLINLENNILHQILTIGSVFLPLSNFIIYFIKANKRANKCLPELINKCNNIKSQYFLELETIENFIRACNYLNSQKIEVINNGGESHQI